MDKPYLNWTSYRKSELYTSYWDKNFLKINAISTVMNFISFKINHWWYQMFNANLFIKYPEVLLSWIDEMGQVQVQRPQMAYNEIKVIMRLVWRKHQVFDMWNRHFQRARRFFNIEFGIVATKFRKEVDLTVTNILFVKSNCRLIFKYLIIVSLSFRITN